MQFTIATIATLLAAANAASITPRQSSINELAIFSSTGCGNTRTGTAIITDSTTCQDLPAGISGAEVDLDIPAGCTYTFHVGAGCSSAQTITIPTDRPAHACFTAGTGKTIGSVLVSGTCG